MNTLLNVYPDSPLHPGSQEIRIFQLLPGRPESKLRGRLIRHDLQKSDIEPSYEALSYRWGSIISTKTIELSCVFDSTDFKITVALESALQALRLTEEARLFWIDAICINQGDIQERNNQVQLMRRIYLNAKTVRIWLDVEIDPNCAAMIKLQCLNDQSSVNDLGDEPSFWEPLSVCTNHGRANGVG